MAKKKTKIHKFKVRKNLVKRLMTIHETQSLIKELMKKGTV
jgi:hypothetical protein